MLVDEYTRSGGDPGGDEPFSFYAAYRAWVRAKVACLRAGELPEGSARQRLLEHARTLAALGERFAWRARGPLVIVVCGARATGGVTSLVEAISAASGLPHLSSDRIRKELLAGRPAARGRVRVRGGGEPCVPYEELGAMQVRALAGVVGRDVPLGRAPRRVRAWVRLAGPSRSSPSAGLRRRWPRGAHGPRAGSRARLDATAARSPRARLRSSSRSTRWRPAATWRCGLIGTRDVVDELLAALDSRLARGVP